MEERFDAGELSGERLLNADADAVRSGEALDDPMNSDRAAADVVFKPKCLGIETSIQIHPANAEGRSEVQAEYVLAAYCTGFSFSFERSGRGSLILPVSIKCCTSSITLTSTRMETVGSP